MSGPAIVARAAAAVGLTTLLLVRPGYAQDPVIVVDVSTRTVLQSHAADTPWHPASLAKLMTLYLTFEALAHGRLSPETQLEASVRAAAQPAVRLGLRRGERISVETAVRALVSISSNDVAVVLAEALAGSESTFALQMTRRARAIGMQDSWFQNATGLPNTGQLTTARDMAILADRLMQDFPGQYHHFSTRSFTFRGQTHHTFNSLLGRYQGIDGLKTGFTCGSGYNVVVSAIRHDRRLIAVVLGARTARERDRRISRLLDSGFAVTGSDRPSLLERRPARMNALHAAPAARVTGPACGRPAEPAAWPTWSWGVYLGIHSSRKQAADAVEQAREYLRDVVSPGKAVFLSRRKDDGKSWKTLLVGYTEKAALRACRRLWARERQCLAQSPVLLNTANYAAK